MASTKKIVISKANGIRFAHRNGLMGSFDTELSCEQRWFNKPNNTFEHILFKDDVFLLQVWADTGATVVVKKQTAAGSTTITADNIQDNTTFYVYEYLITVSSIEDFYLSADSEDSSWESEFMNVIEASDDYLLLEWSNNDNISNTFGFDYTTTLAVNNVNFLRIKGYFLGYKPGGESKVFDNQNEITKLKSRLSRKQTVLFQPIPQQIAEIITVAMQHDYFHVNEVGYVVEDLPATDLFGSLIQMTAELTIISSVGLNADDVGFDCDDVISKTVENKIDLIATGSGSFSVSDGYGLTQIVVKKVSGTPILKIGSTVGGEEIFVSEEITATPKPYVENQRYIPATSGSWNIYFDVSGGVIELFIQTIIFTP